MMLTRVQRIRVAAAAAVDERTIVRAYRRQPVRSTSLARIVDACRALGLPAPPTDEAHAAG